MKRTTKIEGFDARLAKYIAALQIMMNEHWAEMKFTYAEPPTISFYEGTKYVKVISGGKGHQTGVHTFVDKTNGNILKGNWNAPVKNGVRGNIFNEVCTKGVDHHGAIYLR